ncbi:MAG TPA: mercuric reductase [Acidobacteriota bacterium]|nr:mercuric reductase [Acidobacteriota bacterium]
MSYDYDLIVLGAGSGGLPVIRGGCDLGLKVALVEKEKIGGDCLNFGCVPSKTFLKSAKIAHQMRHAGQYGFEARSVETDFSRIMQRLRSVQAKIEEHESVEYFEGLGVDVYIGPPVFRDPHAIKVNGRTLTAKKFVIATGSRAAMPPIKGLQDTPVLTNVELFDGTLETLPESLVVLGGGPIGTEMAQAFCRFGSKVTLVEMSDTILEKDDPDLARTLQEILGQEGVEVLTGHKAVEVGEEGGVRFVVAEDASGQHRRLSADQILVALGRKPNVEGLGLDKAGVRYDADTGVEVNSRLKTTASNIWAVGDVAGPYYFSHTAAHQAGTVFANIFFRFPASQDLSVVPWVTFTDPELAHAGLTEEQAQEQGIDYDVARFGFDELDRAITESKTQGLAKILISKGKIVGVHILGNQAGEVLHTLYLAMKHKIKARHVAKTIYVYPTHSEIINRTLGQHFKKKIYSDWMKKLVGWIY